jgi:ribosomal protein S12 methylthiotransferase
MTDAALEPPTVASAAPRIGFVSLGCPKALTDSELILTRLSAEGYATSKTFAGADLVIVNTCGFIDDAVRESLDTIGEALAANGKVVVTGCLGAKAGEGGGNLVRQMHPSVLAVTGPHATEEVMDAGARARAEAARSLSSTWCRRRPRSASSSRRSTTPT